MKKYHLIAVGGAIMHALAIALKKEGNFVSGSDDHIAEPSKSRLASYELLPDKEGWDENKITADLDAVILGMHAFEDNPELKKAKELGLKIYSFPEFIYEHSRNKQRIVIAGSYGKTTITSMVMHVLNGLGYKFDYLVGSQVPGFDNPVRLSEDAPMIVIEGDEYLASKLDPRPKFMLYHPHVVLISGISWDHINVFPTEQIYNEQFQKLIQSLSKAAYLVYNEGDKTLQELVKPYKDSEEIYLNPYNYPHYKVKDGKYTITLGGTSLAGLAVGGEKQEVNIMGKHNMLNIAGAWKVCEQLAVELKDFLVQIATFEGAKSRLEVLVNDAKNVIIKDFAHAPIKVSATVEAVREAYPKHQLVACVELHTFSSLNKAFLSQYKNSLAKADKKIVFVSRKALEAKRLENITEAEILAAFGDKKVVFVNDAQKLADLLQSYKKGKDVFLMMSSGTFDGLELKNI